MDKLQEQKAALVQYFENGCKDDKKISFGLAVDHFITGADDAPATFDQVQNLMRVMQQPKDESVTIDCSYMGYYNPQYAVSPGAGSQLKISIEPCANTAEVMQIYRDYYKQLCNTLTRLDMRVHTIGFHPAAKAEDVPLIPKRRYELMEEYFKKTGDHGVHMLRATAATQITVAYFSEQDFVQKYRAACFITPLLALLTDNVPFYQGKSNHCYGTRAHVWADVDPDHCGIPANLLEEDFSFAAYAAYILQKPAIVVRQGGEVADAAGKTVTEAYGAVLTKAEIEHILSLVFYDVRLNNYIELCAADSMPMRYITAYLQLIRTIFSSPAALSGVERHYAGASVQAIEEAKLAISCNGYGATVYGKPVQMELTWLLAQAKSRIPTPEERHLLDPLIALVANKKTIWEEEQNT